MDLKEKTKLELEKGKKKVNNLIAEHGIGSGYLSRAKRIQRNVNLVLFIGAVTGDAGFLTWTFINHDEK